VRELRAVAAKKPDSGACLLATSFEVWMWALEYLQNNCDPQGAKLYHSNRQGVTFPMADALGWLLAARYQLDDILELEAKGPENPGLAEALPGTLAFFVDLSHAMAARAAGEVNRICAELVFGYTRHASWEDSCCRSHYDEATLRQVESVIPGFEGGALGQGDLVHADGSHLSKRGPCTKSGALEPFVHLQNKLACCLSGSRMAKDRAAQALCGVMIPEALDYPRA
jgi:hypothetical protein